MKFDLLTSTCITLLEVALVPVFMFLAKNCLEISLQQPWQQEAWVIIPFTDHHIKRLNHCSKYVVTFWRHFIDMKHFLTIIP